MTFRYWVTEVWADLRYGLRALLKRPGYAVMTAGSLALGVAAVTIALSVIDSFLLRPLPGRYGDRLMVIGVSNKSMGVIVTPTLGIPTVRDLAARTDLFDEVAGVSITALALKERQTDRPERVMMQSVTGGYFSTLGLAAGRGRLLGPEDDRERRQVVVLSYRTWQSRFQGDPGVIGRTVHLNTVPFEVIGVAPEGFRGTEYLFQVEGFIPAGALGAVDPTALGIEDRRGERRFSVVARPRLDQSARSIQAALDAMATQLVGSFPELGAEFRMLAFRETRARPVMTTTNGSVVVAVVFGLLALSVLLAAAINSTNLILARASTRQTELAVRQALGASRGRLVIQMVTETLLLAGGALAGGWAMARFGLSVVESIPLSFGGMRLTWGLTLDARVFAMAAAVALMTGLVAGMGPAVAASRFALASRLREGGRSGVGRRGRRMRSALVVAQVAASMIVLVAAGLFVRSAKQGERVDIGARTERLLSMEFDASLAQYDSAATRAAQARIETAVLAVPGVRSLAWSTAVPIKKGAGAMVEVETEAVRQERGAAGLTMFGAAVGPGYFETLGTPILEGRELLASDDSAGRRVAVVNRRAAETLWPGQSALGKVVRFVGGAPPAEVVGVVENGKYFIIGEATRPFVYFPLAQRYAPNFYLTLATDGPPSGLAEAVQTAIGAADRDLMPFDVKPLAETVTTSPNGLLTLRIVAGFGTALGLLAIVLTLVGLYGVVSYSVTQRTGEIGLRMALGASREAVIRSILADGGRLALIGIAVGMVGAVAVLRAVSGLLVGARGADWMVVIATALGLGLAALGSAYIPARRAARIEPVRAIGQ